MTLPFTDDKFFGIDDSTEPENLPSGFAQDTLNAYIPSGRSGEGGVFKTRPGRRALLTSALGQPFYKACDFQRSDNSYCALIATGGGSGEIRKWERDANSTTAIGALGVFNAPTVRFTRLSDWVFMTGNADGKLRRTNLDPTNPIYENCDGLSKPTRTLSSTLANSSLTFISSAERFANNANWFGDNFSGSSEENLTITDPAFAASSAGVTVGAGSDLSTGWRVDTGNVETVTGVDPSALGDKFCRLDEPGSSVITKAGTDIANAVRDNGRYTVTSRFGSDFLVGFKYKSDYGAGDSIIVSVIAEDTGGGPLAQVDQVFSSSVIGSIVDAKLFFSFGSLLKDTDIVKIRLQFTAGPSNRPGTNGPYFCHVFAQAAVALLGLGETATGIEIGFSSLVTEVGAFATATVFDRSVIYSGQQRVVLDLGAAGVLGAGQNWTAKSRIALPIKFLLDGVEDSLRVTLGTRELINGATAPTDELKIETLANGQKYLSADLSVIDDTALNDVQFLDLIFNADIQLPSGSVYGGGAFISIGPLVEAGNLSVNAAPYRWRYREKREKIVAAVNLGSIKSPASDAAGYVDPTNLQAQGSLVVSGAVPQNTENTTPPVTETIFLEWFREGGEYRDGLWRKVAEFNPDSNQAASNGTWSWVASTRTFTDNVGDLALLNADVMLDHEPTPSNVIAIGTTAGRLVLGTATGIYVGQISSGLSSGLYWNSVNNEASGDLALQGWFQPTSGAEATSSGGLQSILNVDGRCLVLYRAVPFVLIGNSAPNFDLEPLRIRKDLGPVGHRAVDLFDHRAWFLGSDGVRALSVSDAPLMSGDIELRLNPDNLWEGAALDSGAYASASLFAAGDRVFLSVPAGASTVVNRTYAYDARQKRWFPWALGPISGGFSFSGDSKSQEAYFTDTGGMIYRLGPGWGDTSTLAGSVSAVAVQVVGRRLRDPQSEREVHAQYITAVVECDEAPVVTVTVRADPERPNPNGRLYSVAYTGNVGQTRIGEMKVGSQVGGGVVQWQIDATTTQPMSLRSVRLDATPGGYL